MKSNVLVDRTNIGVFGKTNAGKSTVMNLLTSQETSIVDPTPGTTADVKEAVMEIHDFGPVKVFDTAGLNEFSRLGAKKKFKALQTLKESDLILLVVDPIESLKDNDFSVENEVASLARQYGKQIFLVYNIFSSKAGGHPMNAHARISDMVQACNERVYHSSNLKYLSLDAHEPLAGMALIEFIKQNFVKLERKVDLLPFLNSDGFVAMNIPVDEETPEGRLLKPQNAVLDYLLRRFIPFAGFRMDLTKARSPIEEIRENERRKYLEFLEELNSRKNLQLLITDSQAIDVVSRWTPKSIPVTTFSIIMINYQTRGQLKKLVDGLRVFDTLKENDRILIAEACNHDRKCDDIGTVQIPRRLKARLGFNVSFDFNFGREFPPEDELKKYRLLVHCGGCMIDSQKMSARMTDLMEVDIPITNYGLLFSYIEGKETLEQVLSPWGIALSW